MNTKRWLGIVVLFTVSLAGPRAWATITASPDPIAIGNVTVNASAGGSTMATSSVSGTGETVASFDLTACTSEFKVTTATPLVVKNNTAIDVTFKPTSRGSKSCTVTMRDALSNALGTFQITGTGQSQQLTIVTSTPVDFGSVRVANAATLTSTKTIVLKNTGDTGFPLSITGLALSGTEAADYTITSPATFPQTVAPGTTLTVTVVFDPSAAGTRTASLDITSDDPANPDQSAALTGTGTNAVIGVSPATFDFGVVTDTQTSSAEAISVTNTAATFPGTLTVSSATITGGAGWFGFAAGNGCTAGATSCTFTSKTAPLSPGVTCTPPTTTTSGTQTATVTFTSDSDAGGTNTVSLSCTAGRPNLSAGATSVAFGNQLVMSTSGSMPVTVTNTGNTPLTFWYGFTGTDAAMFAGSVSGGCGTSSSNKCTVAAGLTFTIDVTFTPSTIGDKTATLVINNNDPDTGDNPTNVALTGHGSAPQISASPSPLAFNGVEVGMSKTSQLTVTNTGDAPLHITSAGLSGSSDFSVATGSTGAQTVAAGGMTSWMLTCAPTSKGPRTATFSIASDAYLTATLDVTLSCTGQQGILTIAPASWNFGGVRVGDTLSKTFTLSNTGNVAVSNITAAFATPNVGYSITAPTLPIASIPAGSSVNVTVQFAPAAPTDGGSDDLTFTGSWGSGPTATTATTTLDGTPLVAGYDTAPHSVDYGTIRYDQSSTKTISIVNTATDASTTVKILSMGITLGTALSGEFAVTGCTHNGATVPCPTATGLNPFTLVGANDTLVVSVKCAPANRVAMMTASLDLHSDLGVNPDRSVGLSATSTTATVAVAPGMLVDFGAVDLEAGAQQQTITIQNMGTAPLDLGAATISVPSSFTFGATPAQSIPAGGSFSVTVTYTPGMASPPNQPETGTITWPVAGVCGTGTTCMGPSTVSVMVSGRGIDRHIVAAPAPMFPDTFRNPGDQAPVLPVTIMNTGEATLHITAVMLTNDPIWQLLDQNPVDVPGGGSQDFHVKFSPTAAGKAPDGLLMITDDDTTHTSGPLVITLHGNGLNRDVAMGPNVIDLGYTGIGIPVRLSQLAPDGLLQVASMDPAHGFTIRSIDVQGGDGTFAIEDANGQAPANLALAASATQDFDVVFTPTQQGDFTATAVLYLDMDPTAQASVELRGHAVFADARGGGGCQAGRGGGPGALLVIGVLVLALRRRRGVAMAAAAAVIVVVAAGGARADTGRDLDLTVFDPTPATTGSAFQLQDAEVGEAGAWVLTGVISYAHDPLVIDTVQNTDAAVRGRTMLELGGAYAFLGRFEAGAQVPLYLQQGDSTAPGMFGVAPAGGTARGDLVLHLKARLWHGPLAAGDVQAGLATALTLPTASSGEFAGVSKPEGRLLALATYEPGALDGRLAIDVNAGAVIRARTHFANIAQGSGLSWGAGASYRVLDHLWAAGEVFGDVIPSGRYGAPAPGATMGAASTMTTIEALAGARYQVERRVNVGLAIGRGMTSGIGSPDVRGILLVTVAPAGAQLAPLHEVDDTLDSDGDGIPDHADRCPSAAEDKDGFQDADGCPDPDNDHDGLADAADKCPDQAEDKDGFQDADGCPDLDNDGDGVPDAQDRCPNQPEDKDGFQDADGCPDPDNDHDGIPDGQDKCPTEPETINGNQDDDGCPDKGDPLVVLSPDRLELLDQIKFNGTKIAKSSYNLLGQVGATLRAHTEILRLRVTDHVQPTSDPDRDQAVSDKRAAAVRDWLVQWGIAPERLEAKGFGGTKPLVPADQRGAAAINERLELIVIDRK